MDMQTIKTENFNWDDIDVGNHALDHSQKFFKQKHFKHERLDESEETMDILQEIDAITLDDHFKSSQDKENANIISTPKSSRKSPLKEIQTLLTPNEGNKTELEKSKNRPLLEETMDILQKIDAITLDDTFKSSQHKENTNIICTPKSSRKSPLKESQTLLTPNEGNKTELEKSKNHPRINPGHVAIKLENNYVPEIVVSKCVSPDAKPLATKELQPPAANPVNFSDSLIARNRARINPGGKKKTSPAKSPLQDAEPAISNALILSESLIKRNKARINPGVKIEKCATLAATETKANIPATTGAVAKIVPAPAPPTTPQAYKCNELYKRRQEERLQKCLDAERKRRQFHCRPVPNFAACHKSLAMKKVVHAVTMPVTPVVLKKSKETDEKRKLKLEELKKMHPPRFEPRPPTVVYEEPFVPKKMPTTLVPCPFNLRSERRLQERKQYDAAVQRANEEKQKQEEEERKKREEIRVKELRKLTTFKARPNPFK